MQALPEDVRERRSAGAAHEDAHRSETVRMQRVQDDVHVLRQSEAAHEEAPGHPRLRVRHLREILLQTRRPQEASELLSRQREGFPLQHLQQELQGSPTAAHEDPQEAQTSRLRPLRRPLRPEVAADRSPEDAQRREAVQMPGVLESVRTLDRPQAAHSSAHRRETFRLHPLRERRLLSASASQEAHAVHPQNHQTVRLSLLPLLQQDQVRFGGALRQMQEVQIGER